MTTSEKQIKVYNPLLKQFCDETKDIEIDPSFSSIFLSHAMSEYDNAKRRIFYFGQDTNGWTKKEELFQNFRDNDLNSYISQTGDWINKYGFLDYKNYAPYGFWTLLANLHLRLKGITEMADIGPSFYDNDNFELLNDFGYGNTNSIEIPRSLENQGIWKNLDHSKYWLIKERSKIFDKLKHTIEIYNPDLVFIFNWGCDENKFLEDLEYNIEKIDLINNHFWIVTIADTRTKIIWTVHPSNLRYQGYNVAQLIDTIMEFV